MADIVDRGHRFTLKDKINVLENRFGALAQYGIADEINNLKD